MGTHNICFRGEIRKVLCGSYLLSGAMISITTQYHHKNMIYRCIDGIVQALTYMYVDY